MVDILEILNDYVKKSQVRIVNANLRFRMLPDVVKKYDTGMYAKVTDMWADLVQEMDRVKIKYPNNKKSIFYIYFVPDDFYSHMPGYENIIGKPMPCADGDGFVSALCYVQSTLTKGEPNSDKDNVFNRVIKLHELSHCISSNFGDTPFPFSEGFSEIIPWYILGYEKQIPTHLKWMRALPKIYSLADFSNGNVIYARIDKKIASYRTSYISLYLVTRAIISNIARRYKISPCMAAQKFLDLWHNFKGNAYRGLVECYASVAGMDIEKLLYTCEYQNAVLDDIDRELKEYKQIQQGGLI